MSVEYKSLFSVGDVVNFQPDLEKLNPDGRLKNYIGAVKCKIVRITFTESKVLYDLALWLNENGSYYETFPICSVDSIFITK